MSFRTVLLCIGLLFSLSVPGYAEPDKGEMAVSDITPHNITYFRRGWHIDVVECFDANVEAMQAQPGASEWFVVYDDRISDLAFENKVSGEVIVCQGIRY